MQGRRQEFFQMRAPGESRGELPAIFQIPGGGGGSTPMFGGFNGQNERIFGPGGRGSPLPMAAYGPMVMCRLRKFPKTDYTEY